MSLSQKYKKSKDKKWALRFHTKHPEGDRYDGIVTDIKREFIVLRGMPELDFDGVVILSKKFLKGYRDSKFEVCLNRILRHTGEIKKAISPKWLEACNSLEDVVQNLKKKNIWPIVEIISGKGKKMVNLFHIGKITLIDKEGFCIHHYDGTGKWEKEYFIEFKEVFRIEFDDQYSTVFNEYMRSSRK